MKKIILITALIFSFVFINASINANAATKVQTFKGQIVSLDDVLSGAKNKQLTKAKAQECYDNNVPLVVFISNKVYFVKNEDGSYAFKKLKDYAHNKKVALKGTKKVKNGINCIIMSNIESLD
ncbi:MAG: hypothetical protein IJK61_06940 [Bacteroidetes bacterium]|nr:hypothetical protein [Bacteroidota bacterium]MBR3090444.1 hypothetical protein [Bacteroidota bacterium]